MQAGTVTEYHETFERYLNRVEDLSKTSLIPIFIAGLKQPIQEKVELQQPTSFAAVMALALIGSYSNGETPVIYVFSQAVVWSGRSIIPIYGIDRHDGNLFGSSCSAGNKHKG